MRKNRIRNIGFPKDKLLIVLLRPRRRQHAGCPEPGKTGLSYQVRDRWICSLQREKSCARIKKADDIKIDCECISVTNLVF